MENINFGYLENNKREKKLFFSNCLSKYRDDFGRTCFKIIAGMRSILDDFLMLSSRKVFLTFLTLKVTFHMEKQKLWTPEK